MPPLLVIIIIHYYYFLASENPVQISSTHQPTYANSPVQLVCSVTNINGSDQPLNVSWLQRHTDINNSYTLLEVLPSPGDLYGHVLSLGDQSSPALEASGRYCCLVESFGEECVDLTVVEEDGKNNHLLLIFLPFHNRFTE